MKRMDGMLIHSKFNSSSVPFHTRLGIGTEESALPKNITQEHLFLIHYSSNSGMKFVFKLSIALFDGRDELGWDKEM